MNEIKKDAVWHDFFCTELPTGLWRGELCGLMWADFDEATGTLAVKRTIHMENGGRPVVVPPRPGGGPEIFFCRQVPPSFCRNEKKDSWSEWIFPNPLKPESSTNPRSVYSHLKALLDSAGLPDIRFHGLRHSYAVAAIRSGDDIKTVQENLGHATASFTLDIYRHVTKQMKQASADRMEAYIKNVAK